MFPFNVIELITAAARCCSVLFCSNYGFLLPAQNNITALLGGSSTACLAYKIYPATSHIPVTHFFFQCKDMNNFTLPAAGSLCLVVYVTEVTKGTAKQLVLLLGRSEYLILFLRTCSLAVHHLWH